MLVFNQPYLQCTYCLQNHFQLFHTQFLTVHSLGTVLGFVISYRTSSSFDRYNEGRRLWSSVILGARTFSRFIWFHVPVSAVPIVLVA